MTTNPLMAVNDAYDFGIAIAKAGCEYANDTPLAEAHQHLAAFVGQAAELMQEASDANDPRSFQLANVAIARLMQDYSHAQAMGRDAVIALGFETAATMRQIVAGTGSKYVH